MSLYLFMGEAMVEDMGLRGMRMPVELERCVATWTLHTFSMLYIHSIT